MHYLMKTKKQAYNIKYMQLSVTTVLQNEQEAL